MIWTSCRHRVLATPAQWTQASHHSISATATYWDQAAEHILSATGSEPCCSLGADPFCNSPHADEGVQLIIKAAEEGPVALPAVQTNLTRPNSSALCTST